MTQCSCNSQIEEFFLIITVYGVHLLNIQKQWRIFSKYSFRPPSTTLEPLNLKVQNFGGDIIPNHNFVLTVHLLNIQGQRGHLNKLLNSFRAQSHHKLPWPKGHELYNFSEGISCHHNCVLTYTFICLIFRSKEENFPRINVFSLHNHYRPALTPEFLTLGP